MIRKDFEKLLGSLQQKELEINRSKGEEYCQQDEDALKNFKRNSERLGTDPITVCALYLFKHIDWLENYIKFRQEGTEGLESRILDIRLYLALLDALIVETENTSSTTN